jgi:hypothetical protein
MTVLGRIAAAALLSRNSRLVIPIYGLFLAVDSNPRKPSELYRLAFRIVRMAKESRQIEAER